MTLLRLLLPALLLTFGLVGPAQAQLSERLASPAGPDDASQPVVAAERVDPVLVAAMDVQLAEHARGEEIGGWVTGLFSFAGAALFLGASIWLAVDVEAFGGVGGPSPILISGLTVVPLFATLGVLSIAVTGGDGDRLRRWREAREGGLTPLELARFEGELRSDAAAARVGRDASFVLSLGVIASGLVTVVAGAALDDLEDDTRWFTIGGGGALAVLGGVMTGLSFLESGAERAWREYRAGGAPSSAGLRVQPVLGPGAVGLVGRF
ncbi:MAG: hypothetical protein KC619_35245 [Myxococcales bacterium]|nr:hypothetical protein [Myxococcales bacterium]